MEPATEQSLICTNAERDVFRKVYEHIQMREPCAVIGIVDMGKKILYREILQQTQKKYGDTCVGHTITKDTDSTQILPQIENIVRKSSLILIVHVASGADIQGFIQSCQHLRDTYATRFTLVLFSDLSSIYPAYSVDSKLILRSLITYPPFTKDDSYNLMHSFESRFSHTVQDAVKAKLFELSGGGAGLLKSLFLLTKDHNILEMSVEDIIQDTSIQYRLETLKNDLPSPIQQTMDRGQELADGDTKLLKLFGILGESGLFFSPLFQKYIGLKRDPLAILLTLCTPTEVHIFELLQKNGNTPTSRDHIAQCLWATDWEDKYSDWAIDQVIHRLRTKLRETSSPYSIKTKKGVGFMLTSQG